MNSVEILSEVTIFSKYAKYLEEKGRRETWEECVQRNKEMHLSKYPNLEDVIEYVYDNYVLTKEVLPAMRSLQFGGRPIELMNNRMFNCAFAHASNLSIFSEAMFLLLGGSGLGYSVQKRHVEQLPVICWTDLCERKSRRYVISDNIEGWADAIRVLLESYFYKDKPAIRLDFRDIRAKGERLVTSGGKAPGPIPLSDCCNNIRKILSNKSVGDKLTTLDVHDILCYIADAVLAGGIRRAALIALFDKDDELMLKCKSEKSIKEVEVVEVDGRKSINIVDEDGYTYSKEYTKEYLEHLITTNSLPFWELNPQRARANNSVILDRKDITKEEWDVIWKSVEDSGCGEPGVYWTNDLELGTNPCVEISLNDCQFCNLTEVNGGNITSQYDLEDRVAAAAFLGTLQAGYTDFHYLRQEWIDTTEREALLGVSITGIGSGCLDKLDLAQAAKVAKKINEKYAKLIGINSAARVTAVKPAGTTSLVLGCSSGVHAWHSTHYIRRLRLGKDEALYKYLSSKIPCLVEDDLFNPNGAVVSFPQKAPEGAHIRHEPVLTLLERVKRFNQDWVRNGHVSGDNTHNVSCTISIRDNEWKDVGEWMWENRKYYSGISVLNYDGGSYLQAPFEDIDEETYNKLAGYLADIDLSEVTEVEDFTNTNGEVACGGGACEVSFI